MNILIYRGKYGDEYYLVDTPERLDAALRQLFKQLDDSGCYQDGSARACDMLTKARAGDIRYIKAILDSRNGYEYEDWDIIQATDPLL